MNKLDKIYDDMKLVGINGIDNFIEKYDDEITIETLLFIAYDIYKYNPTKQIIEGKVKRQFQKRFSNQVKKKYKNCIITEDDADMCEACHIVPFAESDNSNKYNVNNGIFLTGGLHTLFDKHKLSINKLGIVTLSNEMLSKKSFKNYHKYHGMQLKLDKETLKNIAVHYDLFLEKNTL